MAGNGGRGRGKGFVRLTRAGCSDAPRSNTRRPSWRNTPFPGSPVTVPLTIRRHPPSVNAPSPQAQYPFFTGRNPIIPATSGPISLIFGPEQRYANYLRPKKSLIRAGGKTTETERSTAQRRKRRDGVQTEFV